jgi:CheY-like chemotaxis protein
MENGHTILIVDDDAAGRAMLGLCLRQAGCRVLAVPDGQEALSVLARTACDFLITDAKMDKMSGFELANHAKKARPELNIAMISAAAHEDDINGYPIDKFFSKPLEVDRIIEWIEGPAS